MEQQTADSRQQRAESSRPDIKEIQLRVTAPQREEFRLRIDRENIVFIIRL
jgi:hypothetical protein